jgi:hypothetical protein
VSRSIRSTDRVECLDLRQGRFATAVDFKPVPSWRDDRSGGCDSLKSLDDLEQTATLYGDHAFLAFVLTDGQENSSRNAPATLVIA